MGLHLLHQTLGSLPPELGLQLPYLLLLLLPLRLPVPLAASVSKNQFCYSFFYSPLTSPTSPRVHDFNRHYCTLQPVEEKNSGPEEEATEFDSGTFSLRRPRVWLTEPDPGKPSRLLPTRSLFIDPERKSEEGQKKKGQKKKKDSTPHHHPERPATRRIEIVGSPSLPSTPRRRLRLQYDTRGPTTY